MSTAFAMDVRQLVSIISVTYERNGVLRRQGSQVRTERDGVARQAEPRSGDEAAKLPSNPVGRAIKSRSIPDT